MSNPQAFLGTGWSFPPTFSSNGAEVEMVSGVSDIQQSLQILFATRLGERIMHDDFGSDLDQILFAEINQGLINDLTHIISDAIQYHEPRILLNDLSVSESTDTLRITINYSRLIQYAERTHVLIWFILFILTRPHNNNDPVRR